MSLPSPPDPDILDLFKGAILGFRSDLNDEGLYSEILTTTSVKQVHDLVERIQQHQSKAGHLRNLSKIQQYLDKMDLYAGAIDAYVQVQPDILAFIWGPINLLIQWTGTVTRSATQDVIVNVIADIGDLLPDFTGMAALSHEKGLGDRLFLFFQDILDFYSVTLLFFNLSRLQIAFESPLLMQKERTEPVKTRIKQHAMLMSANIRATAPKRSGQGLYHKARASIGAHLGRLTFEDEN